MTARMRASAAPHLLLGALLSLVLLPLLGASPALAGRTITISLTAAGPQPASTTAAIGATVVFRNDDATFVHQVQSKSTNWAFRSPPLAPGQTFTAPTLTRVGEYDYQGADLDTFTGNVVVPAGTTASPAPVRTTSTSAPGPSGPAAPVTASPAATASPSPTGGTCVVGAPPLSGGFGTVGVPGSPVPSASLLPPVVAPNVAPTLAGADPPSPAASGGTVAIGSGRLPEPSSGRRFGLPAALAAVAVAGVGSLLVRLLLAHPAARRPRRGRVGEVAAAVE